jgi:enoyl-CoA hydratase/carnithine racemase
MTLLTERRDGGVLRLTLNRPQAANALSRALQDALVAALADAATDAATRAVVLTGAGGRVFSAGADLREDLGLPVPEAKKLRRALLLRSILAVLDCPKPVVAVVRGKCVGGGAMLALMADEVLLEAGASIAMPEIALAMPSPLGITIISARGGRQAAHRLMQANQPMDAGAALASGLADAVHDDAALDAAAEARAAALGAMDPTAYATNKRWLNGPLRARMVAAAQAAEAAHATGPHDAH